MTCLGQWQWGNVQVEGRYAVQNPGFGNGGQGLGFEGQALGAMGQLCSAGLTSLSLSQPCAQIPGLTGTQGFSLLLPHIVCCAASCPWTCQPGWEFSISLPRP